MADFWKEVNELLGKGKGNKPVKVTADELGVVQKQLAELQQKVTETEAKSDELQEKMLSKEDMLLKKEDKIKELEQNINSTIPEIQGLLDQKEQALTAAKLQLEQIQTELVKKDDIAKTAGEQVAQFQSGIEMMQEEVAIRDKEIQRLKDQLDSCSNNEQDIQGLIDRKNQEMETMASEMDKRRKEIQQMRQEFEEQTQEVKSILGERDQEIKSLQDQLMVVTITLEKSQTKLNDLKTENEQLLAEKNEFLEKMEQINTANKQLEQLISQNKVKITELENQLISTSSEETSVNEMIKQRENQLQTELNAKSEQIQTLETTLTSIKNEFEAFRNNSITEEDYQAAMDENKKLQSKITQLSEELALIDAEKKELTEKLEKTKTESMFESGVSKAIHHTEIHKAYNTPEQKHEPEPIFQKEEEETITTSTNTEAETHRVYSGEGRNVCPKCGSTKIKELSDKTRIISYVPTPVYAKKFQCAKCAFEWS